MHAPQSIFPANVANRFERNGNFDRVAVSCDHSFRLEHNVETEIFALSVRPDSVSLHAERVEIKLVGFPLVIEGVKKNADVIVIKNIVSLWNIGAHLIS